MKSEGRNCFQQALLINIPSFIGYDPFTNESVLNLGFSSFHSYPEDFLTNTLDFIYRRKN